MWEGVLEGRKGSGVGGGERLGKGRKGEGKGEEGGLPGPRCWGVAAAVVVVVVVVVAGTA